MEEEEESTPLYERKEKSQRVCLSYIRKKGISSSSDNKREEKVRD